MGPEVDGRARVLHTFIGKGQLQGRELEFGVSRGAAEPGQSHPCTLAGVRCALRELHHLCPGRFQPVPSCPAHPCHTHPFAAVLPESEENIWKRPLGSPSPTLNQPHQHTPQPPLSSSATSTVFEALQGWCLHPWPGLGHPGTRIPLLLQEEGRGSVSLADGTGTCSTGSRSGSFSCLELGPRGWKTPWFQWDLGLQHIPPAVPSAWCPQPQGKGAGGVIPHLILKISLQECRGLPARRSIPWWQTLPHTQGKGGNPTLFPKAQNIPPSGSRELRERAPSPSVWVPVAALRCCSGIFSAGAPAGPGKCFGPCHPCREKQIFH
ncbi:uncharacterized protein [Aphelocoma coerulescens]|uniref:uncharacterized protein n=1 Tax=Aphelocoma coerulescens TaxID=39617 RepID=UPI0036051628